MSTNLREIVNGTLLPQYNGKMISIIGYVSKVESHGTSFELRTVDDHIVKVVLKIPIQDELNNYVEVHGLAQGKSILAEDILTFEKNELSDFDSLSHNKVTILLNSISDIWKVSI